MKRNKVLGIILVLIGIFILVIKQFIITKHLQTEEENVISYLEDTSGFSEGTSYTNNDYNYIAILEIPKISLRKGLMNMESEYNNIDYNVAIMETSLMPDVNNGNLILAAHNGSSEVSFFRDLENLGKEDIVNIYYNGYKYSYLIDNYYEVEKTGEVNIHRDKTRNTITLITCKNNTDDKQIIYIGYLMDKEMY